MSVALWKRLHSQNKLFFVVAGVNVIDDRIDLIEIAKRLNNIIEGRFTLPFIFKASFDKANRTSFEGYRGIGIEQGLEALQKVKENLRVPILTDVHDLQQIEQVKEVADIIQIPAFLCRQTDLLVTAGKSGRIINLKKGQFASSQVMVEATKKIQMLACNEKVMICERGSCYGVNDLVFGKLSTSQTDSISRLVRTDPRNLIWLREAEVPIVMDCTHAAQHPPGPNNPKESVGEINFVKAYARAAVAVGVDGLFVEVHPEPKSAPVDARIQMPLCAFESFLKELVDIAKIAKYYASKKSLS